MFRFHSVVITSAGPCWQIWGTLQQSACPVGTHARPTAGIKHMHADSLLLDVPFYVVLQVNHIINRGGQA